MPGILSPTIRLLVLILVLFTGTAQAAPENAAALIESLTTSLPQTAEPPRLAALGLCSGDASFRHLQLVSPQLRNWACTRLSRYPLNP